MARQQPLSPRELHRLLSRIADGRIEAFERAWLRSIKATVDSVDQSRLESAIADALAKYEAARAAGARATLTAESIEPVIVALGVSDTMPASLRANFDRLFRDAMRAAAEATARTAPVSLGQVRFDRTNPKALAFARRHLSQWVTEVTDTQRRAIRREIARGFRDQRTVRETGVALRKVIGLTDSQAQTVGRFRREHLPDMNARAVDGRRLLSTQRKRLRQLQSRFPTAETPFTPAEIRKLSEKYRQRIVARRAQSIAQTETIRASAAGQEAMWDQMADRGLVKRDLMRVHWVVTKDSRTECSCLSIPQLNPKGVPLGGSFKMRDCKTGEIHKVRRPGDPHPRCRCGLRAVYYVSAEEMVA